MHTEPDLIPIQLAAQRHSVSLTALYKYVREGRLKRYRRGFDKITYLDSREIERLRMHSQVTVFTLDLPTTDSDPMLTRLLSYLQRTGPRRNWSRAGWGHAVWVNGQKARAYTVFKYTASSMYEVQDEIARALDSVDPSRHLDRHRIRLAQHPFESGAGVSGELQDGREASSEAKPL